MELTEARFWQSVEDRVLRHIYPEGGVPGGAGEVSPQDDPCYQTSGEGFGAEVLQKEKTDIKCER